MKKAKEEKTKRTVSALSLQGGGALGAYEYGAIKALYTMRGGTFRPRVVAGISIGAINAAVLVGAKGDPIEALDELWRKRFCVTGAVGDWLSGLPPLPEGAFPCYSTDLPESFLSLFGNPGMYTLNPDFIFAPLLAPFRNTSFYDTSILRQTLDDLVDVRKLNRPEETRFIVTAVNVKTGRNVKFDNAKGRIALDHILASGSFPVTFPMTVIDGEHYWDGGIFINTPIEVAVNALEETDPDDPGVERELIFVELHRMKSELPQSLQGAAERFFNLMFSGKIVLDRKVFGKYRSFVDLLHEIDKTLPPDSPIRQHPGYRELARHRRIDRAIVIGEKGIGASGSSSDFSRRTLNLRIEAGYRDAMDAFRDAPL